MIAPVQNNVTSIYNYGLRYANTRGAQPNTPVAPVRASPAVYSGASSRVDLSTALWASAYHAEQANRGRVQYAQPNAAVYSELPAQAEGSPALDGVLPEAYPAEQAARMRVSYPGDAAGEAVGTDAALGAEGAQKAADEGRCETCEQRKYQDGSDDISVSYQTPTRIDPDAAAAAVRGHEMEHVYHEQAKARQEGRKVVSQTVTLHTDICPECGRTYISGGTTRTVTKGQNSPEPAAQSPDAGQEEA